MTVPRSVLFVGGYVLFMRAELFGLHKWVLMSYCSGELLSFATKSSCHGCIFTSMLKFILHCRHSQLLDFLHVVTDTDSGPRYCKS